ncbi:endo-1,4-beta-xylanase [Vibrio sp. RC27]
MNISKLSKVYHGSVLLFGLSLVACGSSESGDYLESNIPIDNVAKQHRVSNDNVIDDSLPIAELVNNYPFGSALPAGFARNSVFKREDLQAVVVEHFNQITAENVMKPSNLQPREGVFNFQYADELVEFAEENNLSVHGHTLVWRHQSPKFMENCSSYQQCKGYLVKHIENVVGHYNGRVISWDVVNEAFTNVGKSGATYRNKGGNGSFWYQQMGADYIPIAFTTAHSVDRNAELYYNDYGLESNRSKLNAVLNMTKELLSDSVPIHGIGFQMHIDLEFPTIDDIEYALSRAVETGLKVKITELDVAANKENKYASYTKELAYQLESRYRDIVSTYLKVVPEDQRGGISLWGVSDSDSWIPHKTGFDDWPLLFNDKLEKKRAYYGVAAAIRDFGD